MPNSPEARTPTGDLKPSTPTSTVSSTTSTETAKPAEVAKSPTLAAEGEGGTSLLNEDDKLAPSGAPDAYTDFKAPEGFELDKAALSKAAPVFKELGLTQDQAQKLVDLYARQNKESIDSLYNQMRETRAEWRKLSETYLGTNSKAIKADIGTALNIAFSDDSGTPDSAKLKGFREYMDMTGAGDNPFFVEAFHKMAKFVNEGKSIHGIGPSSFGQKAPDARPTSLAAAVYPNLARPQSG